MKLTKTELKQLIKQCLNELASEPEFARTLLETINKPTVQDPNLHRAIGVNASNNTMRAILEDTANNTLPQQMANDPNGLMPQYYNQDFSNQGMYPQQMPQYGMQQFAPQQPQYYQQHPQMGQQLNINHYQGQQNNRPAPNTMSPSRWASLAFNKPITNRPSQESGGNFLPGISRM